MSDCTLCWTSHAEDAACPPAPREESDSRTFEARYSGRCTAGCGEPIEPGDLIGLVDGRAVHAGCLDGAP